MPQRIGETCSTQNRSTYLSQEHRVAECYFHDLLYSTTRQSVLLVHKPFLCKISKQDHPILILQRILHKWGWIYQEGRVFRDTSFPWSTKNCDQENQFGKTFQRLWKARLSHTWVCNTKTKLAYHLKLVNCWTNSIINYQWHALSEGFNWSIWELRM